MPLYIYITYFVERMSNHEWTHAPPPCKIRTFLKVYSKAKLENNGDRTSPCFKPFVIGNTPEKYLPTGLCYTLHFYWPYQFHVDTKLNENITQDLLLNWIIRYLNVYKQLMHCFVVSPFFLKYLTSAEYMISS